MQPKLTLVRDELIDRVLDEAYQLHLKLYTFVLDLTKKAGKEKLPILEDFQAALLS